jgi:hypothetical protein
MNKHLRHGLLIVGLATMTGCGANADTLLRMSINQKSELTDRLMKVTDEESAKKFVNFYFKNYVEVNRVLDERWQKWIKDIEDDMPKKDRILVVAFKSSGDPGSEEWARDARDVPANANSLLVETREAFIAYMKKVGADAERFEREKARIANLLTHLVEDKISQEKANGEERPSVDSKKLWPNLAYILEPATFRATLITGAYKRQPTR